MVCGEADVVYGFVFLSHLPMSGCILEVLGIGC